MFLVAVVEDLFFSVQITSMAQRSGLTVRYVSTAPDALAQAALSPALVLVDLNLQRLDTVALIRELKSQYPSLPVAAYVSHVQVEMRRAAAEAGADPVIPRSAFSAKLPLLLQTAAGATPASLAQ